MWTTPLLRDNHGFVLATTPMTSLELRQPVVDLGLPAVKDVHRSQPQGSTRLPHFEASSRGSLLYIYKFIHM